MKTVHGGEEFVVILSNTNIEGAQHIAQAIQNALHALNIPHSQSSAAEYVTLSQGVSCCIPNPGDSPDTLVASADQALYEAKEAGRNRFISKK